MFTQSESTEREVTVQRDAVNPSAYLVLVHSERATHTFRCPSEAVADRLASLFRSNGSAQPSFQQAA